MIYEFQIEFKIIFGIETTTQKTQTKCQPKLKKIAKFAFVRESIVKERSRVANPFFSHSYFCIRRQKIKSMRPRFIQPFGRCSPKLIPPERLTKIKIEREKGVTHLFAFAERVKRSERGRGLGVEVLGFRLD